MDSLRYCFLIFFALFLLPSAQADFIPKLENVTSGWSVDLNPALIAKDQVVCRSSFIQKKKVCKLDVDFRAPKDKDHFEIAFRSFKFDEVIVNQTTSLNSYDLINSLGALTVRSSCKEKRKDVAASFTIAEISKNCPTMSGWGAGRGRCLEASFSDDDFSRWRDHGKRI